MNKRSKLLYLLLLTFLPFIYSCEEENPEPVVSTGYTDGILVVNQGNFGQGNGSLDFYSNKQEELTRNVYEKVNEEPIGGMIQNVAFHDTLMFIVTNNKDKVIMAGANSFQAIHTIEDFTAPRYITTHGDKAYVSVWGPYGEDFSLGESKVAVIDLTDFSIQKQIPVAAGPEGIITVGDKIFVANNNTNVITVIDSETDEIIKEIETEVGPTQLLQDINGTLWISFSSGFLIGFNPETYQEEKRIAIAERVPQGRLALYEGYLYFRTTEFLEYPETFNAIYKVDINDPEATPQLVLEKGNMYTFGIDPENGHILAGIAAGADPGTIIRFDQDGNELENFAAGVFPHEIIFR